MCGDEWLCTSEGAAGTQGCTGCSPGAPRGCWLGTGWSGGAGAAPGRRGEPRAPPAPRSVGCRQRERRLVWGLAARGLPVGSCRTDSCRTPGLAGDGVWVQPAPAPALGFLPDCKARAGLCRVRAAVASLRAGGWLRTDLAFCRA